MSDSPARIPPASVPSTATPAAPCAPVSPVLTVDDLPLAELSAAALDGELFRLDEVYAPVDEFDRPTVRAASIARVAGARYIAERHSAAWVLGALDRPPAVHELCTASVARTTSAMPGHRLREVVLDPRDLTTVGQLVVTNAVRTVVDLARTARDFSVSDRLACTRLLSLAGLRAEDCRAVIERRRNLPGKHRAWDRIRSL